MERPKATIEQRADDIDHELTQPQADFIALTDALLEHRTEDIRRLLSHTDIAVKYSPKEALDRLAATRVGQLLAADDAQLAIESDGSYHPVLDLRKMNGRLVSVSVRVWAWDSEKIRYLDDDTPSYPRGYKKYKGETDKTRRLDVNLEYVIGGDTVVVESVGLYGSTSSPDYVYATSQLWVSQYAESGYEGHGSESIDELTDEEVYEFLDCVASLVGDTPESFGEMYDRKASELLAQFRDTPYGAMVSRLASVLWPAQLCFEMTEPPLKKLGLTLADGLCSSDPAVRDKAAEILEQVTEWYEARRRVMQANAQ